MSNQILLAAFVALYYVRNMYTCPPLPTHTCILPPSSHTHTHSHLGLYLKGHDVTKLASMAKLKAGRLARELTDSCLQYWGGMGYTAEVEVSRMFRDMRLLSIGAGADEVMLSIICKFSGTLPKQ